MRKTISCCAALAIACIGQSAVAESSAYGVVSFTSISLTDLDPLDGIAPSLLRSNVAMFTYAEAVSSPASDSFDLVFSRRRATLDPVTTSAPVPAGFQVDAAAQFSGGPAGTLRGDVQVGLDGRATAYTELKYDFVLSPHTSVTFVGSLFGRSATVGQQAGANEQLAWSDPRLLFTGNLIPLGGVQFVLGNLSVTPTGPAYALAEISDSLAINYTITNDTDQTQTTQFWSFVGVHARNSSVAMVPEPSTYACMLAGLVLLSAAARRRQVPCRDSLS